MWGANEVPGECVFLTWVWLYEGCQCMRPTSMARPSPGWAGLLTVYIGSGIHSFLCPWLQPETFPMQRHPLPMENSSPPHSDARNMCAGFLAASIAPFQPYPFLPFLSLCLCFFVYWLCYLPRSHLGPLWPNQVDPKTLQVMANECTNAVYSVCSFPPKLSFSRLSS